MDQTMPMRRVAVALFEGFTVLDVYGPVQAFASCRLPTPEGPPHRLFEIFSMAEHAGIINSGEGPPSYAPYSFANAPAFDILLIPGGFGTRSAVNNTALLQQLTAASQQATITTTRLYGLRSPCPHGTPGWPAGHIK